LDEKTLAPLFEAAQRGDSQARERLFASLYSELRQIAQRELRRRGPHLSLGATTLLHEAYLNLGERQGVQFPDRARFLAYAARAMRGLIISYARSRQALKRGGAFEITSLGQDMADQAVADSTELERLSDAIEQLAAVEPRLAEVVDLKYFGGFSFGDNATMWRISERTIQRDWEKARLLLHRALTDPDSSLATRTSAARTAQATTTT